MSWPEVRKGAAQLGHALRGLVRNRPLEWVDPDTGEVDEVEHVTRRFRWTITRPLWLSRLGAKTLPCGCGRRLGRMVWYSANCAVHSGFGAYRAARKEFLEHAGWDDVSGLVERLTAAAPPDPTTMRGDRGFFGYADFTDGDGMRVRVYQSSALGGGPAPGLSFVWLAVDAAEASAEHGKAHAHLDRQQAGRLVRALVTWLDQVEEAEEDTDG